MASAQNLNFDYDPELKAWLLSASASNNIALNASDVSVAIDTDLDGEISVVEAALIHSLDIQAGSSTDIGVPTGFVNLVSLSISNFADLYGVNITNTAAGLQSLHLSGLPSLSSFSCVNTSLASVTIENCNNLNFININDSQITDANFPDLPMLASFSAKGTPLTDFDFSGCDQLSFVDLRETPLTSIDLSGFQSLTSLELTLESPLLSLDVSDCPLLDNLMIPYNVAFADVSDCTSMTSLNVASVAITTLNLQGCNSLPSIYIGNSGAPLATCPITSIDFSNLPSLNNVIIGNTNISSMNLANCPNLTSLNVYDSPINNIDFSQVPNLTYLTITGCPYETLDISGLENLTTLEANYTPTLKYILAKNGSSETFYLMGSDNLEFICQDQESIASTLADITTSGLTAVEVNDYCSTVPGGDFNTITGTVRFDDNDNGCDASDLVKSNVRIDLMTNDEASFTGNLGHYFHYVGAGTFNFAPNLENPALYTITPASASASFATVDNSVITQDFCIARNGNQADVEIVLTPLSGARPGFTCRYAVVIRNKGNITVSGNFNFSFPEATMDFISSNPVTSSQSTGNLQWTFSDLLPFESRSAVVNLYLNSPTQTPAVNIGDLLQFLATITPVAGDILPLDNEFGLKQTTVGSYDPNDIVCLEGATVSPSEIGNYLHYNVNFENTGTAAAQNVVVKVEVDTDKFDMHSLQLMNSSHASFSRIRGNIVEFIFEDIELESPQGDPPTGGHGNVLFKIKSKASLVEGDEVAQKADIFFDYNFPIETNEAETVYQALKVPGFEQDDSVSIYPNPSAGKVTVKSDSEVRSIEVFDVQGRLLQVRTDASEIDVSIHLTGLYFIRIKTDNGSKVERLIKK